MTNSTSGQIHSNVIPSEVGWQFVPQYYTFVNKQPHRLHCFYTKASTFIHGTEGEDGKPCFGQQEIHNRITSIGFHDCKVFIHSVDAQSSANGGIIIQVIGEMSNRGEVWRKFVQTFFLAEQPNGYFVLNDIFRFLKEEAVEIDEDREDGVSAQDVPSISAASAPSPGQPTVPIFEAPVEPEPVLDVVEELVPVPPSDPPSVEEPYTVTASEPVLEPQANGVHNPAPEPEPVLVAVERSPAPVPAVSLTPEPPTGLPDASPSPAISASALPPAASPAPSLQHQHGLQSTPPQPTAPSAPKSWAHLAAANSKKWGAAVAQESRGTTEVPTISAPPSAPQSLAPPSASAHREHHSNFNIVQGMTTPHCFVKGVVESVQEATLKQVISQRFGPIKELELVRNKACAFLEFVHLDSAKRAIATSSSAGGVKIDVEGHQVKIFIETKKDRSERPPSRPRGGAPGQGGVNGGDMRGGFRGRGGPNGRGRGVQK